MIVGFGLLCCVTVACFFPHELMPGASSGSFISFNIGIGVASTLSAIAYALVVSGKADGSAIPAMAFVGYGTLVAGILLSGLSASDIDASVAPVAGVLCGLGLSFTMLFWFGLLTFLSDRRAAFTQGWQALIGELLFIALALLPLPYFKYALLLLCAVSGALGIFAYRVIARTYDQPYPAERFGAGYRVLANSSNLLRALLLPLGGFLFAALLYGVVEAVAMSVQGSPWGFAASVAGSPVGAAAFLVWQRVSRKRDCGFAIKVLFAILAVVLFLLPFDGVAFCVSVVYQMTGLLAYSLIIDQMASRRRMAIGVIALCFALSHAVFLAGLYVPGYFGVTSYGAFLQSTTMLLFLVYAAFGVLIVLDYRQNRAQLEHLERILQLQQQEQAQLRQSLVDANDEDFNRACTEIGHDFGLTKRETEVLQLLARGRDVAYVCNELFLARNTVKGYTKSIYAKLGVHSKQDVIDMVERVYRAGSVEHTR